MANRKLSAERLEDRVQLTGTPYGALPEDTAEYMLGQIAVTVVLLESNGIADPSTENWNEPHRQEVLEKIEDGLAWWKQTLAKISDKHSLDFVLDRKFVDTAFSTDYEPISRRSDDFSLWVNEFLVDQGFGGSSLLDENMKAFNHSQRLKHKTDWAFTIFVVNSQSDPDGQFAGDGSFAAAFSFAGGLFQVVPSTRPASTFAHETGHMFWGLDEYAGGASYYRRRGYYSAQNTNSVVANPDKFFSQRDSIMAESDPLERAFVNRTSPESTLALVGWQDTDRDGLFDVLDVPLKIDITGQYDPFSGLYRWTGSAGVGILPNLNSSGNQSSITIDKIARFETRIQGRDWTVLSTPNSAAIAVDITTAIASEDVGKTIEFRAVSDHGVTSQIFSASISPATNRSTNAGIHGFAWNDLNRDGLWGKLESGLAGQTVSIAAQPGTPPVGQTTVRASQFGSGPITSIIDGISLNSVGAEADGRVGVQVDPLSGEAVFHPYKVSASAVPTVFDGKNTMLKVGFPSGTHRVETTALSFRAGTRARMDAFRSDGSILARSESQILETMNATVIAVESATPIAYAILYGRGDDSIAVKSITTGIPSVVTTDALGGYSFPNLPAGTYQITATGSSEEIGILGNPIRLATLSNLALQSQPLSFSFLLDISAWTNPTDPFDTNNDGLINGVDVVLVINTINRHGGGNLASSGLPPRPFIDVNNDGYLNPLDALAAINHVNRMFANRGQAEGESSLALVFDSFEQDLIKRRSRRNLGHSNNGPSS